MNDYLLRVSGDEKLNADDLRATDHIVIALTYTPAGVVIDRYERACAAVWLLSLRPDQHEALAERMRVIWQGKAEVTLRTLGAAETLVASARVHADAGR